MSISTCSIKDGKNFQKVNQILIRTLFLNWLVASIKIFVGFAAGCLSIIAEGFHSFFDGMSNILGLVGIKIARRPPDSSHPYGHRKFEAIAALGIAFMILIADYELFKAAMMRFFYRSVPDITSLSFLIMIGALVVDFWVYRYENTWGKRLNSPILIADSLHTKSRFFTTPSVILGMILIKIGFPLFDPIVTLLVIVILIKLFWEIVKENLVVLTDRALIDIRKIQAIAQQIPAIKSIHRVRTRGDGLYIFLDLHVVLSPDLSLKKAHQISHQLKEKLMREIPQLKDIIVHLES